MPVAPTTACIFVSIAEFTASLTLSASESIDLATTVFTSVWTLLLSVFIALATAFSTASFGEVESALIELVTAVSIAVNLVGSVGLSCKSLTAVPIELAAHKSPLRLRLNIKAIDFAPVSAWRLVVRLLVNLVKSIYFIP